MEEAEGIRVNVNQTINKSICNREILRKKHFVLFNVCVYLFTYLSVT
jgi:hypothetical protein